MVSILPEPLEPVLPHAGQRLVPYVAFAEARIKNRLASHHFSIRHYRAPGETCPAEEWFPQFPSVQKSEVGVGFAELNGHAAPMVCNEVRKTVELLSIESVPVRSGRPSRLGGRTQ